MGEQRTAEGAASAGTVRLRLSVWLRAEGVETTAHFSQPLTLSLKLLPWKDALSTFKIFYGT